MKFEIEIEDELCGNNWGEDGSLVPQYHVVATFFYPYRDRDNYLHHRQEQEDLKADSIEDLYERMGQATVEQMIRSEQQNDSPSWGKEDPSDYYVEFSNIRIEAAYYSEDKMKASNAYQNQGAAIEEARRKEEERKAAEAERYRKWCIAEQERKDRQEFERLSKKFKSTESK